MRQAITALLVGGSVAYLFVVASDAYYEWRRRAVIRERLRELS